ncbi:hypothetical protein [Paludibaculum fermentans]|uniref:hypothetical protein n=1 Tax=Paludibaculum fermentans TaxID=1473598 RepID=UPI003EBEE341
MCRLVALLLCFAMLVPARDIRSKALQLPIGTTVRLRIPSGIIEKARLHSVTDEGISVLVLESGALKEQSYRYAEIRHLERRAGRMSAGRVVLTTVGVYCLVALTFGIVAIAASR